jgi:hypothetical protein
VGVEVEVSDEGVVVEDGEVVVVLEDGDGVAGPFHAQADAVGPDANAAGLVDGVGLGGRPEAGMG